MFRPLGRRVALASALFALTAAAAAFDFGRAAFTDPREPPVVSELDAAQREAFELGRALYNTSWVVAGTARAGRRDGLGPMFNTASCDACHNNGARGRSPPRDSEVSGSFVLQLEGPGTAKYGHVLNTSAIEGFISEAQVAATFRTLEGHYPDGARWRLYEPVYRLMALSQGPLDGATVLRPRIAPALFGTGLLEAVDVAVLERIRNSQSTRVRGSVPFGRFGWQAASSSIQQQTERALAREMGIRSVGHPDDDCSPASGPCLDAPTGGTPEIEPELLDALIAFQRALAVPLRGGQDAAGRRLFEGAGCADCHRPELDTAIDGASRSIDPFSDLLLHDLGAGLADRRRDGRVVPSKWRTAPLWGLRHAIARGDVALLHDGRARSVEEAILWHGGQATDSRRRFTLLSAGDRRALLDWVSAL